MKTVLFTNWTDEDFTGIWDKQDYLIKKGTSIYLEDWKAEHFAKHLADRELLKQGLQVSHPSKDMLRGKCFGVAEEVKSETEIINKNANIKAEEPKVEVREPKEEIKIKKGKPKKEVFEGLKSE